MKFLNTVMPPYDLTYSDVFMVPQETSVQSRFDVDLSTPDGVGTIPIVVANMTAVAGKRMAETIARRGGIAIIPQDVPLKIVKAIVGSVGDAHPIFETPITLNPESTIAEALNLIHKRAHGVIIVIDNNKKPVGIFTEKDADQYDRFAALELVMSKNILSIREGKSIEEMHSFLVQNRLSAAPVINKKGELIGLVTAKGCLRSEIYTPNVDTRNRMRVGAAISINGDVAAKAKKMLDLGIEILVLDTAHGHQQKMIEAVKACRKVAPKTTIVAGNVVTREATRDLINAGASIVKVGVGPGAMCTTRMMTGVGRPQFSAVYECSDEAKKLGGHVWADGGIRYPRDVALALAAGASNVMFASWLAGTFESAADVMKDESGRLFKESFGMASQRAVRNRNHTELELERAKKELFEEGISTSKFFIDAKRPGVEDIVDQIVAGLRSACTYAGAHSITDFQNKAVVGVQSASGYQEGMPVASNW